MLSAFHCSKVSMLIAALSSACIGGAATGALAQYVHGPATGQTATAAQPVLEPGDVYLAGSRVYGFVGKTGLGHEHAVMGQLKEGNLRLDQPENSGQLVFDMTSFTADTDPARRFVHLDGSTDLSTRQQVNSNMLGPSVLDVAHYPTAVFAVRHIAQLPQASQRGFPQYQIVGDFTLHGVTQPIQVMAEAEEQNGWIHLRGGFSMLQTQFGIKPFSKAFGALGVTDQLSIWGDLWLSKDRQVVPQAASIH